MRLIPIMMMLLLVTSTMSGCTGQDSGEGADTSSLQSEISNLTSDLNDANEARLSLETTLGEAFTQLGEAEDSISDLQGQLEASESMKESLESQLSDALEQLNSTNPDDQSAIDSLQGQIVNLTAELANANYQISSLEEMMELKTEEIQSLEGTIAALQSTMSTLTYDLRERVESCPQDNSGMEMAVGYDDGAGAAIAGDGRVNYDEVQFTVGECPGDSGMVSGIQAGDSRDWGPALFVEMGGVLYFSADDGVHGWELWRSDGSVGGTYIVKDVREEECTPATDPETGEETENCENYGSMHQMCWPGYATNCFIPEMVAGNNKIFFTAFDSNPGTNFAHIFVSDGTEDGTYRVRDQWIGWDYNHPDSDFDYSGPSNLMVIPSNGFTPDRALYTIVQAICVGDYCNQAFDPASGEELWITDGTDTGTYMLVNMVQEDKSWNNGDYCCMDDKGGIPRDLIMKGDTIWFTARTDGYGRELYRYGMNIGGGLFLVKDINEGTGGSNPMHLTSVGPGVYLSADNGTNGQELHYSLGNTFNTVVVKDINPGANGSSPQELTKLGSNLFFTADDGENGRELWVSDSTEEGTFMVKDINTNGSSFPNWLRVMDGTLYFMAYTEDHGKELWRSDGTADGTYMVKDINPGNNSSFYWIPDASPSTTAIYPHHEMLMVHGDSLYFAADAGEQYGVEVWRTDGTVNGTELVIDIVPGSESSWPNRFFSFGDKLYFTSYSEERGRQLWFYWDNPGPIIG
jgi:ELWxxDGT repeat protein